MIVIIIIIYKDLSPVQVMTLDCGDTYTCQSLFNQGLSLAAKRTNTDDFGVTSRVDPGPF